jgi:hypothetical protein
MSEEEENNKLNYLALNTNTIINGESYHPKECTSRQKRVRYYKQYSEEK